jgi:hypothetical protein
MTRMNEHSEVKSLLPWFLNGTLDEHEQARLTEHLGRCEECQDDARKMVRMARMFSPQAGQDEIRSATRRASADFVATLHLQGTRTRARWRPGRTVTVVVMLLMLGIGISVMWPRTDLYRTLGTTPTDMQGEVVQIVFSSDASEKSIREVLLANDNKVLSGPTRQGVYRVALGAGQRVEIVIARLQNHPDVIFAEHEMSP